MNKFRVLTEDRSLQSKMCLIRPFSFIHSLNSLDEKNIPVGQTQIILHTRLPTFSKDHWRLFWKNNYSEQFVFFIQSPWMKISLLVKRRSFSILDYQLSRKIIGDSSGKITTQNSLFSSKGYSQISAILRTPTIFPFFLFWFLLPQWLTQGKKDSNCEKRNLSRLIPRGFISFARGFWAIRPVIYERFIFRGSFVQLFLSCCNGFWFSNWKNNLQCKLFAICNANISWGLVNTPCSHFRKIGLSCCSLGGLYHLPGGSERSAQSFTKDLSFAGLSCSCS